MAINLNNYKMRIYEYVESRMAFIAPNLSHIVGASTAAKMMGMFKGSNKKETNFWKFSTHKLCITLMSL